MQTINLMANHTSIGCDNIQHVIMAPPLARRAVFPLRLSILIILIHACFVLVPVALHAQADQPATVPLTTPLPGDQIINFEVNIPADCTTLEAIEYIFAQIPSLMPEYTWASNELQRLHKKTMVFTPVGKKLPWIDALRALLKPHELDFVEDGRLVRVGPVELIEKQRLMLAQERLRNNHNLIKGGTLYDGQALKTVLEDIQTQVGIIVNYNYMEPADLQLVRSGSGLMPGEGDDSTPKGADLSVKDVDKRQAAADAMGRSVTYRIPIGSPQEWRSVLREVLDPWEYDFVEIGGVVRPMTRGRIKQFRDREINEQPLLTRVIRIYHANPVDIVAQLDPAATKRQGANNQSFSIFKHEKGFICVSGDVRSTSKRFGGSGLTDAQSGEGVTIGGKVADSARFSDMDRPRTPPAVVIGDIASNLEAIEAHIRSLDKRERQIVIEAKIFEVGADIDRKLGVNWTKFGGAGSLSSGVGWDSRSTRSKTRDTDRGSERNWVSKDTQTRGYETTAAGTAAPGMGGNEIPSTSLTYGIDAASQTVNDNDGRVDRLHKTLINDFAAGMSAILTPFELEFYWEAVQDSGDFKMVSQPVLVIGDHSEALIRVGTVTPAYTKTTSFAGQNDNMSESYEWQMIQDGVSLWVVPEICPDGRTVRLSVHPQFSVILGSVQAGVNGEGGRYPVMGIREVDTRVVVPSGNTLLLGGLIEANSERSQRKIPLLGDIPFLGRLFRWDGKVKEGKNLVILLTPTILDDENPESGYEKPAEPVIEGMLKGLGKNLEDPSLYLKKERPTE